MSFNCWASVADGGLTFKQHWFNALHLHDYWQNSNHMINNFEQRAVVWWEGVGVVFVRRGRELLRFDKYRILPLKFGNLGRWAFSSNSVELNSLY